jgi:hypothetical protein
MHVLRSDLENLVVGHGSELAGIQTHLQACPSCQTQVAAMLEAEHGGSPTRVKVLDPISSLGPSAPAKLLTISTSGLHVRVSLPVFVGALVQVHSSDLSAFGRVRYCIPAGSEFQIGVKLQSPPGGQVPLDTNIN